MLILFAICMYQIGTVLCSASQSMIMFIVARAFCGLGIGAFDTLMKIVMAGKNRDRKKDSEPAWGLVRLAKVP